MRAWLVLVVAVSGGLGAALRYVVDRLLAPAPGGFPVGILLVNVSGSFALGLLTGFGTTVAPELAVAVGMGLLGGYTTFSTVSVETVLLAQRRRWRDAALNLFGTLALAVIGAGAGLLLGGWVAGTAG